MFYATFDPRADLSNGSRGFANTVKVCRFETRADRDAFVADRENQAAAACTRKEAAEVFASVHSRALFGRQAEWMKHENIPGETASSLV